MKAIPPIHRGGEMALTPDQIPPQFDWITQLVRAGPAAIFATLWWLERGERKDLQKALMDLGEKGFTALEGTKSTLDVLRTLLIPPRNGP